MWVRGSIATLDHAVAYHNAADGIYVESRLSSASDDLAYDNAGAGLRLVNPGPALVAGNRAYGNDTGLAVSNDVPGASATVGSADLGAGRGNVAHDNVSSGIGAVGNVDVVGNAAYGQTGGRSDGISVAGGASARLNIA